MARFYYDEFHIKHPFAIVFRYAGTVWPLVLPYCLFNTFLLTALTILKHYTKVNLSILPQGHALMSLLIAYLGVSKVNLAYERYMSAQIATGHAFMILRELNQLSITLTEEYHGVEADEWRDDTKRTIVQLIHETVAALRNERHAAALARNVGYRSGIGIDGGSVVSPSSKNYRKGGLSSSANKVETVGSDDPMVLVHALRSHLYHNSTAIYKTAVGEEGKGGKMATTGLELFERCKLIDILHEFIISYRNLLRLASSPLPFVLVQMGRTFIFIWTLTIPLVLTGDNFAYEYLSAFFFVILLTYGFLGLEFVSRMLSNPFGGEIDNDFNIWGMGSAAIVGIEEDSDMNMMMPTMMTNKDVADVADVPVMTDHQRNNGSHRHHNHRASSPRKLREFVQMRQQTIDMSTRYIVLDGSKDSLDISGMMNSTTSTTPYRNMDNKGGEVDIPSEFL